MNPYAAMDADAVDDREGLDLRGADLSKRDLSNLPLDAVHLEHANLREANLQGAHLGGAYLEHANLRHAHLVSAKLGNAHLGSANLRQAHLQGADLRWANLEHANLEEAYLASADLQEAHLQGAHLQKASLGIAARLGSGNLRDLKRLLRDEWTEVMPKMSRITDLRGAFFDVYTQLSDGFLSTTEHVSQVLLADVWWGNVNLAVVKWEEVEELCDEHYAEGLEDYMKAVRANRQLAVALREQGMNEVADRFFYRSQELQRKVFWPQRQYKSYFFLLFSWALAGYGYRPWRTLGWYLGVIFVFGLLYYWAGFMDAQHRLTLAEAFIGSVTAFHGRGLFGIEINDLQGALAAIQAVVGLAIEVAFIATLTQRFFGK